MSLMLRRIHPPIFWSMSRPLTLFSYLAQCAWCYRNHDHWHWSHILSNAHVIIKPTSANICIWSTPCPDFSYPRYCSVSDVLLCSSPQGFPSHILYLVSDLFMWYVKNVRLHFSLFKPAALNMFQLCQNMYCVLEAAMYLKESFSDRLWVSLGYPLIPLSKTRLCMWDVSDSLVLHSRMQTTYRITTIIL